VIYKAALFCIFFNSLRGWNKNTLLEINHTHWVIHDSSIEDRIKEELSNLSVKKGPKVILHG